MNRRHRLSGSRAFAAVRAQRCSAQSGPVRVHAASNGRDVTRAGFSIPKGVGGAVQRNRVRRRLRAALATQLAILGGVDLVISIAAAGDELTSASLAEHLDRALAGALAALALRTASGGSARAVATPRLLPA